MYTDLEMTCSPILFIKEENHLEASPLCWAINKTTKQTSVVNRVKIEASVKMDYIT